MENNSKVRIGCQDYTVIFKELVVEEGQECRGSCHSDRREIYLKESLKDTRLMETFLHECIHAISDEYDLSLTEVQVNTLGISLLSLIRDNKLNFLK